MFIVQFLMSGQPLQVGNLTISFSETGTLPPYEKFAALISTHLPLSGTGSVMYTGFRSPAQGITNFKEWGRVKKPQSRKLSVNNNFFFFWPNLET